MGASGHNSYYSVLYGLASVIIVLILLGSISLIYNAFSISVSDRTRQFGILSSVGATRRQLRSSVLYEALLLGGIGVPLGNLGYDSVYRKVCYAGHRWGDDNGRRISNPYHAYLLAVDADILADWNGDGTGIRMDSGVPCDKSIGRGSDSRQSGYPGRQGKTSWKPSDLPDLWFGRTSGRKIF